MERKYIKLGFAILFIILVAGGGFLFMERKKLELSSEYSSFFEKIPKDWKTYRNEKYGFEMKYPSRTMEGKAINPIELPLTGTTIFDLEAIEDIHIPYIEEKQGNEELFNIGITVIPGDLSKLESSIAEASGQKSFCDDFFCNRKLFYSDGGIPIYEFSTGFFENGKLTISKKYYFILDAKKKLIFYVWYNYNFLLVKPETAESYLPAIVFEGILSTFKFF